MIVAEYALKVRWLRRATTVLGIEMPSLTPTPDHSILRGPLGKPSNVVAYVEAGDLILPGAKPTPVSFW